MNGAEKTVWLCILMSVCTFVYVALLSGKPTEFVEAYWYVWPFGPYALIAAFAVRSRRSEYWRDALIIVCLACALTAVVRYLMFFLAAGDDPGYATIIIRLGLWRVPLEQYVVFAAFSFAAWILKRARDK